jgi:hypothetical protein
MSETKLVTPIVHLNGTSKAELLRLREEFYAALDAAVAALREMAPNGRDYYPGEAGLMERAVEQHRRRCASLTDLMREMEEECRAIQG